ncbi:1-deoxy-D-xylulose-5-phosphate synthase [bacterium]|nr:1-deoxy-D-xylulose-5-phosphate synthase [bacterium]
MSLLEKINSPQAVKKLTVAQLKQLSEEIRVFMVDAVSKTGGHLASSLGAVELTLALHHVYQTPQDKIVWDVGHQTYAHKIISGRRDRFATLRQYKGLSGFPKREESPYDTFNTGHSSTSISAALGMARARDLTKSPQKIIAVIGDGSLSNGTALEALNDAGHKKTDLLVILNDNRMSISRPVGGLSNYLNQIITGRMYNRLKSQVEGMLAAIPAVGKTALGLTHYLEEATKGLIVPGVLFEELGFRYLGPVDGNDVEQMISTLKRVKDFSGPILLHVLTQKGKGFSPAEQNPVAFHGTPKFDARTGQCRLSPQLTFSQAFSQSLLRLAKQDKKVVAIVAAMTSGTALDEFAEQLPERFFDVGIAEGHAVTLAAGMASQGYKPVVTIYSTFLQRAYDQIVHDVCLQNLPVVFALDRAGLVGEDGPTHHGVFDIAYLRHIPNLVIFSPGNESDLAGMLKTALARRGPTVLRYPRGAGVIGKVGKTITAVPVGKAKVPAKGSAITLLAVGNMVEPALAAARVLETKKIATTVVDVRCIKPLDTQTLLREIRKTGKVVTIEDHVLSGGFGSAVLEMLASQEMTAISIARLGLPDAFVEQGSICELFEQYGLTSEGIVRVALSVLDKKRLKMKKTGKSGTKK